TLPLHYYYYAPNSHVATNLAVSLPPSLSSPLYFVYKSPSSSSSSSLLPNIITNPFVDFSATAILAPSSYIYKSMNPPFNSNTRGGNNTGNEGRHRLGDLSSMHWNSARASVRKSWALRRFLEDDGDADGDYD